MTTCGTKILISAEICGMFMFGWWQNKITHMSKTTLNFDTLFRTNHDHVPTLDAQGIWKWDNWEGGLTPESNETNKERAEKNPNKV